MRGGMGNMQKMMKQMQKMQKDMQKAQEELAEKTVEGTAGGGMVTVVVNGQKQVIDVNIKEDVVDPEDIEM
ncbi:YbaB/EbfC family nucleoid-associated protein, partial [Priestia megaterium]|uniref:YbaB/EbfC family nucleoid-associated protein n=1 Tax=Priestia megaterium TaxID=1404 RepID=UPI002EA1B07B|nr:YbaB/EbfC family nucleoid-associated protein [Priestia megaterium]